MYFNFILKKGKETVELDQAYTAKSVSIQHIFHRMNKSGDPPDMPLYVELDFMSPNNYKTFDNMSDPQGTQVGKMNKLINIGHCENGKCIWKDLYIQLTDPSKHEAVHIPKQINFEFSFLNGSTLEAVEDTDFDFIEIVMEIDPVF